MEDYLEILAERMKLLREEKGYSIRELASYLNIGKSAISQYENCKNDPQLSVIVKYTNFFNVDINWLLGLKEERK